MRCNWHAVNCHIKITQFHKFWYVYFWYVIRVFTHAVIPAVRRVDKSAISKGFLLCLWNPSLPPFSPRPWLHRDPLHLFSGTGDRFTFLVFYKWKHTAVHSLLAAVFGILLLSIVMGLIHVDVSINKFICFVAEWRPLYGYTSSYLSLHPLVDIWVIPSFLIYRLVF